MPKEKYIVHQTDTGFKVDYYKRGKYKRSIDFYDVQYVEVILKHFKKEVPKGEIIFSYSGMRNEAMVGLQRKVMEYEP